MRYQQITRGDTAVFELNIEPPEDNYDWTGATVSFVITADKKPTNNDNALLYEKSKAITVNSEGLATVQFELSSALSSQLIPGTEYHIEYQLEKGGEILTVATVMMGVDQDYVV